MAIWLASLHTVAALAFAALIALVASTNPLRSRAGVFALGTIVITLWSALLVLPALEGRTGQAYLSSDPLLVLGWLLILASLVGAVSVHKTATLLRAALVGVGSAIAGALWLDQPVTVLLPMCSSLGASAAALWLLAEMSLGASAFHRAVWLRFAPWAAALLILNAAVTLAWTAAPAAVDALLLVRGAAALVAVPALVLLCTRTEILNVRVFVSRQVLTAAFIAVSGFLAVLLPAFVVYRLAEGRGLVAPFVLSIALAVIIGFTLLFAFGRKQLQWVRVQISKHFYRFKYDYREEWLRLTNTLASASSDLSPPKRAIKALADIIDSQAGALFISEQGSQSYVAAASWNTELFMPLEEYRSDDLIAFMEKSAWIVDSVEYKAARPKEAPSFLDDILSRTPREVLVVPLLVHDQLFGFVVLTRPENLRRLTYEDIDVLRTGGREVAGLLGQYYLAQRLTEVKQFEEFGRMTAFLVHDLTNISAQQSLILQNAERHKNNAQFIDDAMRTIAGSVDRINRLVALVRSGLRRRDREAADAATVVKEAVRLCAGYSPTPIVTVPEQPLVVLTEADRLSHGLAHLIRNSQQATSSTGKVTVSLHGEGSYAVIKVSDDGAGMSADFVQERLFRPFDSTKKGAALGIGAFQLRDIVKESGGTLGVHTVEGAGSTFTIRLPLHTAETIAASA